MIFTKVLTFLFLLSGSVALASTNYEIDEVEINCKGSGACSERLEKLEALKRNYTSLEHIRMLLKLYMRDPSVQFFSYSLEEKINSKLTIAGNLVLKKQVDELDLSEVEDLVTVPSILPLMEGSFYDFKKEKKLISNLRSLLSSKGYPSSKISVKKRLGEDGFIIRVKVVPGIPRLLKRIVIVSGNKFLKKETYREIHQYLQKPLDLQSVKESLEEIKQRFISYGYYKLDFKIVQKAKSNSDIGLFLEVVDDKMYSFHTTGNHFYKESELKKKLADTVITLNRVSDFESVKQSVKEFYHVRGFLDVEVTGSLKKFTDINDNVVLGFHLDIDEGQRYKIGNISFNGNSFFSDKDLTEIFYKTDREDASDGYHQEVYYHEYVNILRNRYLNEGFVNILIEKPKIVYDKDKKLINIEYQIREVARALISNIVFEMKDVSLVSKIKDIMVNKSKKYFNPIAFDQDLKNILTFLRNEGYYYARLKSIKPNDLVRYNQDNTTVDIVLDIELDQKYLINDLIIIGNYKTKAKLIRRESGFKRGSYLTESNMRFAQTSLLALGLFSRVFIRPIKVDSQVDLFIDVEEKDFGLLEIAPGYRTDLGYKISAKLSYLNLEGMNKQFSFNTIINRRENLNSLDPQREEENKHLLEYQNLLSYSENKIFDFNLDYNATLSSIRRRFYSFDADIARVNNTVSSNVNNWFSYSFKHQLERISQYNSTLDREHGHFQIGALTPGITLDFRDNRINPLKGAYFNLTCELANEAFGSQSTDDLVVNYYKLVSRNKFYLPMGDVTMAISVAAGVQKNQALAEREASDGTIETEGYIPNIKVFRLTGVDLVRGFEDGEINRLVDGDDISTVRVDDTAYMASIKIEPRVFLSDTTMLGVFYDAGRVFVDEYNMGELRSSAGLTFKYLTPVGSLDFDYGIKLLRKRDSDGRLESPGRLHVSIGFF